VYTFGDRNGFAEKPDVPQTDDLEIVEILPHQEIEQEGESA
jgi:hypothetical protein